MTKLIIRWTNYVPEKINEETEEIIEQSHYNHNHEVIDLNDILKVETHWGRVKIYKIDGTIIETNDDECEIYFR